MSIAVRTATTTWTGPLATGTGTLSDTDSGVLDGQQVTWAARSQAPGGKTSPEELIAAAHASCFSMALSAALAENGTPPQRLQVSAVVTLDEVDGNPTITSSALTLQGQVAGIDSDAFTALVQAAAAGCPVSRLYAGAAISVDAALVG
ncbi:MAG: OsmC family peroxiredoxin [Beutenbergiaceae bacterium]